MKKKLLCILIFFCTFVFAQPTILYTGLSSTTPSPNNNRFNLVDKGIYKQFRLQANQSASASSLGWAFHIGSTGTPDYSANWRASSGGNTLSVNNFINIGFANGANYTNNAGVDGLLPAITNNNYYTFNVDSGLPTASVAMALLETTYNPTALVSQSVVPPSASNGAARVTITAAAPLNTGEYVYMRYASNVNFTGSTLIEIPFVGAVGNFFMPCFAANTNIYYYFFSSNKTFTTINNEFTTFGGNESVYDMSTLNMLNNGGPNYTYTQPNTAAGDFAGNYYIPSTCYPTLNSFINALNVGNVVGPVTVNVAATHTETAPLLGYPIIKTGTAVNPIIFRKDGVGAGPIFTAPTPQTSGSVMDAVFKIIGADYITIDGFTMLENAANTVPTPASNNMTEFGVALFYATSIDGAQNNTIQNCTITLNKTNLNSMGIYSNTQHNSTNGTTSANITNATGTNSNNKFYGNIISNVNLGIIMIGTDGFNDSGNDIGGTSLLTGNTITNQGSTTISSSYPGFPGTSTIGILVSGCTNSNIAFNTIASTTSPVNAYGIFLRNTGTSPTIVHTSTINNNVITVSSSSNSNSYDVIGILNDLGGTNHTLNINDNEIKNCATTSATFAGMFCGIRSTAALPTINITGNKINNNTISGASLSNTTSNRSALIKVTNIQTLAILISGNTMTNNAFNNTGTGDIVAFDVNGNYTGTCTISNNIVDGLTTTGTGSIYGYLNVGSPTGALTVSNNNFKNVTISGGGVSSKINFVNSNTGNSQVLSINGNTIDTLTINTAVSSSGITGIFTGISATVSVFNNIIKNINSLSTNIGIQTSGGALIHNVYGNIIDGMTSNAAGGVNHYGIRSGSNTGTTNIYNNKVYNISTGTSTNAYVFGIECSNGTTGNVYNNMVADIKMPAVNITAAASLRAITISIATNANVYNNSVYLTGTSTGADFSAAAFCFPGTTTTDIRNNIFVNTIIPKGVGYSAAIMRLATGTNGVVPITYSANSNNNCLYAPSVNNGVIYVEGQYTTGAPTNIFAANCFDLSAFKTFVSTRETTTFSEIPPFVNIAPTTMDLHLNTVTGSGCFNGGQTIALVTNDIDGVARPIGGVYDIGADEAAGTLIPRTPPTITYTPITDLGCSAAITLTATITTPGTLGSGVNSPRMYYKKLSDANNNFATANNNSVSGWKFVTATGSGPFNFAFNYSLLPGGFVAGDTIQYFVTAQDTNNNVAITSANVSPCPTTVVFTSSQIATAPPTINQFTFKTSYSGAYTVGTAGNFTTLTGVNGLFDSINKGLVSGNITATIISDISESGTTALNEWAEYDNVGCVAIATPTFRLTVQSDGNVRTISGTDLIYNASTLKSLINLNGADRVTFNGGTTTQRNLVFRSTNATSNGCIPVFKLGDGNGSSNIIINNCDIQSNSSSITLPIGAGILVTSVGTNNNNLFQNNNIHDATVGTPGNLNFGIYVDNNVNNVSQILDNNLYNIRTTAIQVGAGASPTIGNGQIIIGNSIYDTGAGTLSTTFTAIDVRGTIASGHTISNNFIGGAAKNGGVSGNPFTNATVTTFRGIYLPYNATNGSTTVSNNQITNINLSSTSAAAFSGIDFTGLVNCTGNTIGHETIPAMGIFINAASANGQSNNYGIIAGFGTAVAGINITNNKIKYLTHVTSSTSISRLVGIYYWYSSTVGVTSLINNNTVAELTSNLKNSGFNAYASGNANTGALVAGILSGTVANTTLEINDNTIFNISDTGVNGSLVPNVLGIAIDGSTINNMARNRIYGLTNQSPGSAANAAPIIGIRVNTSSVNKLVNNMITITNAANTNPSRVFGVLDNSATMEMYFNSIYIGGSQATNNSAGVCSAPYISIGGSGTEVLKNNIFHNTRTSSTPGTGTLFHYALAQSASGSITTSNYNNLLAAEPAKLCLFNTTSYTLVAWQALSTPSTPDLNSLQITPTYVDQPNGDLHISSATICPGYNLFGTPIAGITQDYDLETRNVTVPQIGADENGKPAYTWSGAWSPAGTPTINSPVTFNASYDMTSLPSVDACSVTIDGPTTVVTVANNKYLNIQNDLTVKVGSKLIVQNQGNLVQVNDLATVTNNGTTEINKTSTPYEKYDYTYWSTPIANALIGGPFAAWRLDYSFYFKTQNFQDLYSGIGYPQTTGAPDTFDDTGDDWQPVNALTTMVKGLGYAIMAPTNVVFSPPPTASVVFSGLVNNGIIPVAIEQSLNTLNTNDDYNLVGNPYPSAISADAFIKANILPLATSNKISGTLYFWTHKGDIQPVLTNPGPYIINYNSNDYALYNLTGPVATGSGTMSGSGGAAPLGNIASCQGFFVESQSTVANTSVVFNNSMRNKTYNNNQFYRNSENISPNTSTASPVIKDRIWLNFENSDHMFSQQLIGYLDNTTLDFDYGYDGMQNNSQNYVKFYSFMNNSTDLFRIQSRGNFDINDQIQLGYSSAVSGTTTISIDSSEGVLDDVATAVYLQDNLLNITHDLKQAPYVFSTNYGTFNDRFVLKYIDQNLATNNYENNSNLIKIAAKDQLININSLSENIQSVTVYDILGRLLFDKENINSKSFAIENLNANNQTLILKIKLLDETLITKKFIMK